MKLSKFGPNKVLFILIAVIVISALAFSATVTWAQTTSPSPSPSATATPSPTPSPTASPSPSPSVSPTASPSPTGSPSPAFSPAPSPSPTASPSPVSTIPPEISQNARDWPLPNRDYAQTRATTDSTINSSNVNTLGVAWTMDLENLGLYGGAASNPLIMGNTVYFQDLQANVYALDLATGQTRWTQMYNSANAIGPNGPSVGWGKVFAHKDLFTLAALDLNNSST